MQRLFCRFLEIPATDYRKWIGNSRLLDPRVGVRVKCPPCGRNQLLLLLLEDFDNSFVGVFFKAPVYVVVQYGQGRTARWALGE